MPEWIVWDNKLVDIANEDNWEDVTEEDMEVCDDTNATDRTPD